MLGWLPDYLDLADPCQYGKRLQNAIIVVTVVITVVVVVVVIVVVVVVIVVDDDVDDDNDEDKEGDDYVKLRQSNDLS